MYGQRFGIVRSLAILFFITVVLLMFVRLWCLSFCGNIYNMFLMVLGRILMCHAVSGERQRFCVSNLLCMF